MITDSRYIDIGRDARRMHSVYRLEAIGYSLRNPPLERLSARFPDKLEIGVRTCPYAQGSQAELSICGERYCVGYPHAVIKPPLTEYSYHNLGERDIFLIVYPTAVLPALEASGVLSPPYVWELSEQVLTDCEAIFAQLRTLFDSISAPGVCDTIDALAYLLLTKLLLSKGSVSQEDDPHSEWQNLMLIDSYFRSHFSEDLQMDRVARHFHLSRSDFFRKWRKHFDCSPKQHLNNLRMAEAARLLRESGLRIGEIATRLSFANLAYFCAAFKRCFQVTPEQYRRCPALVNCASGEGTKPRMGNC